MADLVGLLRCRSDQLCIDGDQIQLLSIANPAALPWQALAIDVVLEL